MLPTCQKAGTRLVDQSDVYLKAAAQEAELMRSGKTQIAYAFDPLSSNVEITGFISPGANGGPLADMVVVDSKSGQVITHFRIPGDPEDWDNLGEWERHMGVGTAKVINGHFSCDIPEEKPTPNPTPKPKPQLPATPTPPAATCTPAAGGICLVFSGQIKGAKTSPHTVATGYQATFGWKLEWQTSIAGYGVPNQFVTKSSDAFGHGEITYQSGIKPCTTGFELLPTNPPTLAQGGDFSSKSELTIEVPNPGDDSTGGGAGYPAIGPTNSACPALLTALPGNFTITVPLKPGTTTLPIKGGSSYDTPATGTTGSSTMFGTITVVVG